MNRLVLNTRSIYIGGHSYLPQNSQCPIIRKFRKILGNVSVLLITFSIFEINKNANFH